LPSRSWRRNSSTACLASLSRRLRVSLSVVSGPSPIAVSGRQWLHEIKHNGFRVIARKTGPQVRLYSRPGNDLTYRFPLIVETLTRLRSRSCIIDGEAVGCDDNGVASFNRIRYRRHDESIFLYAFRPIELNGEDLRRDPLEGRKATLEMILAKAGPGIRFNEHMEGDGETVFRHAFRSQRRAASAVRRGQGGKFRASVRGSVSPKYSPTCAWSSRSRCSSCSRVKSA
jgi:bifunctional non-homologous end joining protein LigD